MSTHPGLWGQFAGLWQGSAPGTLRYTWGLPDHWGQTRDREDDSVAPMPAMLKGYPSGLERVSFPSTQGMAGRAGLLFLQSGLADRAAQGVGEGPRKENKKKEIKNQWLKYCVTKGGLGVPGPSPGGVLSTWRGQHEEGWNLADGFGLGV